MELPAVDIQVAVDAIRDLIRAGGQVLGAPGLNEAWSDPWDLAEVAPDWTPPFGIVAVAPDRMVEYGHGTFGGTVITVKLDIGIILATAEAEMMPDPDGVLGVQADRWRITLGELFKDSPQIAPGVEIIADGPGWMKVATGVPIVVDERTFWGTYATILVRLEQL